MSRNLDDSAPSFPPRGTLRLSYAAAPYRHRNFDPSTDSPTDLVPYQNAPYQSLPLQRDFSSPPSLPTGYPTRRNRIPSLQRSSYRHPGFQTSYDIDFEIDDEVPCHHSLNSSDYDCVVLPWSAMLPPQQYTPMYPCDDPPELEVRMLYRELNPDPRKGMRTVSRWRAGLNPLLLIFQHWAVEVGSSCSGRWYRYELQYYRDGSRLRVTPSDEEDIERMNYEEMPHVVKRVFKGKTRLSFGQISDIAECIISKRRRYILGVSDCHNFAIELINQILTFRNRAFMGVKLGESIIRRTFKPIFLGVTNVLEWAGKIRDPIQSGIDWCQGWFLQHDDDDGDGHRRIQYNQKRHYDDDDDDDDDGYDDDGDHGYDGYDYYDDDDEDDDATLEQQDVAKRYVWK